MIDLENLSRKAEGAGQAVTSKIDKGGNWISRNWKKFLIIFGAVMAAVVLLSLAR